MGFSPKFLKTGSVLDLFASIRWHNIVPMVAAGLSNLGLVKYLIGQLAARQSTKFSELQQFVPNAKPEDWYRITLAGQRVQVIKKDKKKLGVLQFGTEVVAAADGSIAGLLGASPGASTAVPIMVSPVEKCFPDRIEAWRPALVGMIPSYGKHLSDEPAEAGREDACEHGEGARHPPLVVDRHSNTCSTVWMRWNGQQFDSERTDALPGLARPSNLVRSVNDSRVRRRALSRGARQERTQPRARRERDAVPGWTINPPRVQPCLCLLSER